MSSFKPPVAVRLRPVKIGAVTTLQGNLLVPIRDAQFTFEHVEELRAIVNVLIHGVRLSRLNGRQESLNALLLSRERQSLEEPGGVG